jgi:hypothetical protein
MTRVRAHTQQVTEPDEIVDRLRESGHSVGRTRRAVVDAVRARDGAFTADELAAAVPEVHVATVYRTLALLEEIGALRHVHLSHGAAIYEPSVAEPPRRRPPQLVRRRQRHAGRRARLRPRGHPLRRRRPLHHLRLNQSV